MNNDHMVVRELTLDNPGLESQRPKQLIDCNEFLLLGMDKGAAVWNPWLKQTRVIKSQPAYNFQGIGYDSNKESGYKTTATYKKVLYGLDPETYWTIYDFATDMWTERKLESNGSDKGNKDYSWLLRVGVSLNGNLYWAAYHDKTDPLYHLHVWDVSSRRSFNVYHLPCGKKHPCDALVLGVFKEDRLSLLKQCHVTKKIEIWVTKNKINSDDDDVVWISFMQVSVPNLPDLMQTGSNTHPSYFIDNKRLVLCCCDETGRAWIYVMGENKLISKIKIESVVDHWPLHCTYFPSLVPVPRGPREEAELQV